jgi:hypothetical protein
MFSPTRFYHWITVTVYAVAEMNIIVADAPLAQGGVVVEVQHIVNRHLMANFARGGATA